MASTIDPSRMPRAVPLVSVVVPAYKHERYISEALESIAIDGYPNIEVVIIDDGSPDGTWTRIQSWASENAKRYSVRAARQENVGLTRTLNRLLSMAGGEYVTMLTSDDRLRPGGIERRVSFLEANPDMVAVFGDCRVIDLDGHVIAEHGVAFGDPRARRRLLADPVAEIVSHWSVQGPVILYRRDAVRAMGGYSEDLMIEDWELYLRLASKGRIAFLPVAVADYRWHGANTVALAAKAAAIADEMRGVAWRSRHLFRGKLYVELVHESAAWAARAAKLRKRPLAWASWRSFSIGLKLVALLLPRRYLRERTSSSGA